MRISAIILAAGYSSRMGKLKALLPLEGETLLHRAVRIFQTAGVADIVVVTGYERISIEEALIGEAVRIVYNPGFNEEMFSSVKVGAAGLAPEADAFYVLPVDIPLQSAEILLQMNKMFNEYGPEAIIHPCYQRKRGHPPLISVCYRKDLLAWQGPAGLKGFLSQYEAHSYHLEVDDEFILNNINTPEQYQILTEKFNRRIF
ncbi:MAG TPA: nucleotidyltransferase family protein [Syntrophomonas sp.]|nr:nucleotidyltransferase family protein [Syntrophomonas sp.]